MNPRAYAEVDNARAIIRAMRQDIEDLERWWPAAKRGLNARRVMKCLTDRIDTAELCCDDAIKEASK